MRRELTRSELEALYLPPSDEFVFVDVPKMKYFMVDGEGSPDDAPFRTALQWLHAAVAPIKREGQRRMGKDFIAPPLEGLWWADDMADLAAGVKDRLKWRMMIPGPNWATKAMFAEAVKEAKAGAGKKRGQAPASLRLGSLHEGRCVQIMHIGPNAEERATLARLHGEFLPAQGLVACGPHHEIYLNDPRRTAPAKLKTVLRQPVRKLCG